MKIVKWVIAVVAVVAIIVVGLYLRRDYVAYRLANSALEQYDMEVSSISVNTLTPETIAFGDIVIESASGARYAFSDLVLTLTGGGTRIRQIAAQDIAIEFGDGASAATGLSGALQNALNLPAWLPDVEASVASLSLPGLPSLAAIRWSSANDAQVLTFELESTHFTITTAPRDDGNHSLTVAAVSSSGDGALALHGHIDTSTPGHVIGGVVTLQTGTWIPLLRAIDLLPGEVERVDAQFRGEVGVSLDQPAAGQATVRARLELVDELNVAYLSSGSGELSLLAHAMAPLDVELAYPSLAWRVASNKLAGTVLAGRDSIPVIIHEAACTAGVHCTMRLDAELVDERLNTAPLGSMSLSLPLTIDAADTTQIAIGPGMTGTGVVANETLSVGSVTLRGLEQATFVFADSGWQSSIGALGIDLDAIQFGETSIDTLAIGVRQVAFSQGLLSGNVSIPAGSTATRSALAVPLPGVEGEFRARDGSVDIVLTLSDLYAALSADVAINIAPASGAVTVSDLQLSFANIDLGDYVSGWDYPFDVVDGTITADAELRWISPPISGGPVVAARIDAGIGSLAGQYDDYGFADLDTRLVATLTGDGTIDVEPSTLTVGLVDVGLPLENLEVDYALDIAAESLRVDRLSLQALGGKITAEPFAYSPHNEANQILLSAHSIQLQLMVDLAEFDNVAMTGSMSGPLPLTIGGGGVEIGGGRLESDGDGGVIRYGADDASLAGVVPDSDFSVVTQALSNFEFDSLTSDVQYTENGDLLLKMQLSGLNPDVDATQPIILNLGIENNVPQLLRSLRAIRSVEDILEQRTGT